jgi:hypothetical protein
VKVPDDLVRQIFMSAAITAAAEIPRSPAASMAPARIEALDWTKGALILCMVAYHAINYSAFRPLSFRYLAFLPPSFILITGFLVGRVYASKYDLHTWRPYARLLERGAKLLVIFVVLNVLYFIASERSLVDGLGEFGDRALAIFGYGNGRNAIFEVLLPIAYFLLLAPALLWARGRFRSSPLAVAGLVFLLCVALDLRGISIKNLVLLSAGIIGMAFGVFRNQGLNGLAGRWWPALVGYLAYRLSSYYFGERYPVQMFGATSSVFLLYCCAVHCNLGSWVGDQVVFLGRYSLLGYLLQIALLQALVVVCGGKPNHWTGVLAFSCSTAVLLILLVRGVDHLRKRTRLADLCYRTIFA